MFDTVSKFYNETTLNPMLDKCTFYQDLFDFSKNRPNVFLEEIETITLEPVALSTT